MSVVLTPSEMALRNHAFKAALGDIERRHRRAALFGEALAGSSSWDLLIEIFVAVHRGREISVTDAAFGACVRQTTALRWLRVLQEDGLIDRRDDPFDGRRSFLSLTPFGLDLLLAYFGGQKSANAASLQRSA